MLYVCKSIEYLLCNMESPSTFAWNKLRNFNWQIINKTLKYYTL